MTGVSGVSFLLQYAEQSLMKSAIKTSEESWIEQQMLEDKKRATDWEATNEAIEEQVARESYLQWLQDQEKQARQVRGWGRDHGDPRYGQGDWSGLTANLFTFSPVRPAPPAAQRRRQHPADLMSGVPGHHGNVTPTPPTLTSQALLQLTTSPLPLQELPSF